MYHDPGSLILFYIVVLLCFVQFERIIASLGLQPMVIPVGPKSLSLKPLSLFDTARACRICLVQVSIFPKNWNKGHFLMVNGLYCGRTEIACPL